MGEKITNVLAFPLDLAVSMLTKQNIAFSVEKTSSPKCFDVKGQFRVIRQVYENDTVKLTIAAEDWHPLSLKKPGKKKGNSL